VDWWKIYCGGKNVIVTHLHIYNIWNAGVNSFKLQGSNDDSSWNDVYSGNATSEVDNAFTFVNTTSYKYYRILRVT
jgi:hypothetical protein